jgi:hypothetical protein
MPIVTGGATFMRIRAITVWASMLGAALLLASRLGAAEPASAGLASELALPRPASPYDVGNRAQLLIDRLLVRDSQAVAFTLHQGKKHPANPLLVADQTWEGWRLELFGSVLYEADEQLYKMWYIGESPEDFPDYATLYATSRDGIAWEKPLVSTVASRRGGKTNAVLDGYMLTSVIRDDADADPARRYKMICWKQKAPGGYHALASPDGLNWTQVSEERICPSSDVITGFYDPRRGIYAAFPKFSAVVRGRDRRCFGLITSRDFAAWTKPHLVLRPDARDDAGSLARIEQVRPILDTPDDRAKMRTEFYGMGFYLAESCTLSFPWVFTVNADNRYGSNQEGPIEIQLAVSRDLLHWQRPFRTPVIDIGQLDQWDASCHMTAAQAIRVGDEIRLYYSGGNYTHGTPAIYYATHPDTGEPTGRKSQYASSIGLVSWQLDRFVSVDGPAEGGTLTTVPLKYQGSRLELNGRTDSGGKIVVELLDAAGKPLAASQPFSGDDLRHTASWPSGVDLAAHAGQPVCLRFQLYDAELFSFAFRD